MRTFKFKLYNHKRNRKLKRKINISGMIWNHCIALHRRYYRLYGKSLNVNALMKHLTKLKKLAKYAYWRELDAQAVQDVAQRIDKAYKKFFEDHKKGKKTGIPKFKKVKNYSSFTLKQTGYKIITGNEIIIMGQKYKYFKSREIEGIVKTIQVKRDSLGDMYIFITCETNDNIVIPRTGNSVGFDFGLKMFLTGSDGTEVLSPEWFKKALADIRKASRKLSSKKKGSNNRYKANKHLARVHKRIANQRHDFHFKLAGYLSGKYATI